MSFKWKNVEVCYPSWHTPPPYILRYIKISDIFNNYERIATTFSVVSLLSRRWVLSLKKYKYVTTGSGSWFIRHRSKAVCRSNAGWHVKGQRELDVENVHVANLAASFSYITNFQARILSVTPKSETLVHQVSDPLTNVGIIWGIHSIYSICLISRNCVESSTRLQVTID